MPPQDGVRRHQRRHLAQGLPSEAVAVHRESAPLGIGQTQTPPVEVLLEDAVLFPQVRDNLELVAIHPARKSHEEDPEPYGLDHGPSLFVQASVSPRWGSAGFSDSTVAGMAAVRDYRGERDEAGRPLAVTIMAIADEIASAAELVMEKVARVPVAVVRGVTLVEGDGRAQDLLRAPDRDLFR